MFYARVRREAGQFELYLNAEEKKCSQGPRTIGIRYYGIGFWTSPERHLTALVLRGAPKRYYGIGFSLSPERYLTALVLRGAERYGTA